MQNILPYSDDESFFHAHYFHFLGVRELALIALTSKTNEETVNRLVSGFGKAQLDALALSIEFQKYKYWRMRPHHLEPGTLVWIEESFVAGIVRIIGRRETWSTSLSVACDPILIKSNIHWKYYSSVPVTCIQHYGILEPGLEVAVARLRLNEAQEKLKQSRRV